MTGSSGLSSEGASKVQGSHADTLVGLGSLFSNSTSSSLKRALVAFQNLEASETVMRKERLPRIKQAKRLTESQLILLVERYTAGDSTYQLANRFRIDRHTVSNRLKSKGVKLRR